MKFGQINRLILFGGSSLLTEFTASIPKSFGLEVLVFSSRRHLKETVWGRQLTLEEYLKKHGVTYFESPDINNDLNLKKYVDSNTLGIAFGASWVFNKKTVNLFRKNHLLDFMGIDLPRYRGGAHITWQILHNNKIGASNLQIIEGGMKRFHRGEIIKEERFRIPANFKKPIDYYNFYLEKFIGFLKEFIKEMRAGKNFSVSTLDEEISSYYPFLFSEINGLVDWNWDGRNIVKFIDAFDEPYCGASTYWQGRKVFLKDCHELPTEDDYHPFTSGLVVRKNRQGIYVAVTNCLMKIGKVTLKNGKDVTGDIELGNRFFTPIKELEKARTFQAVYDASGLKRGQK